MKTEKKSWINALFAYAGNEKKKMVLSIVLSVLSVILGLLPFYFMYELICLFVAGTATTAAIIRWCLFALAVIDWRLALASLITFPLSFLCMGLTFKISGKNFEKYDQSANYMNSTIVEYIEGIEVIKAFGRAGSACRDAVDLHGRLTRQAGGILRKYASGKVHGRKLRGIS